MALCNLTYKVFTGIRVSLAYVESPLRDRQTLRTEYPPIYDRV